LAAAAGLEFLVKLTEPLQQKVSELGHDATINCDGQPLVVLGDFCEL
jgi:hypothetical protein